jgi:hypothetical protein
MVSPYEFDAAFRAAPTDSAPSHGRNNTDLIGGADGRREFFEVSDVFIVDVDVDEPAQLVAVKQPLVNGGILGAKMPQDLADRRTGRFNAVQAPRVGAQRSGDSHDWHGLDPR